MEKYRPSLKEMTRHVNRNDVEVSHEWNSQGRSQNERVVTMDAMSDQVQDLHEQKLAEQELIQAQVKDEKIVDGENTFKQETLAKIERSGHSQADVDFVASSGRWEGWDKRVEGDFYCTIEDFLAVAEFNYDNGYGAAEINTDLKIVFKDGSWLERGTYDGAEWWVYKHTPAKPAQYHQPINRNGIGERGVYHLSEEEKREIDELDEKTYLSRVGSSVATSEQILQANQKYDQPITIGEVIEAKAS